METAVRAYYTTPGRAPGRAGDFYTSVHVHPLFGAMLAAQLREMWEVLDRPTTFTVVECGAGAGWLAQDIIAEAVRWPDLAAALRYVLVDVSDAESGPHPTPVPPPLSQNWERGGGQGERRGHSRFPTLTDVTPRPIVGCVLSNEFVDALPVHRVRRENGLLREVFVGLAGRGDRFVEVLGEPSTPDLAAYLAGSDIELAEGQEIEVNLAAWRWLEDVNALLARGFVLTIDYGYQAAELRAGRFPRGSLMAYRRHTAHTDLYQAVGEQDLTAHVNWTALVRRGEELGLRTAGLTSQARFLLALGILERAAAWGDDETQAARARRAAWQLVGPGGLGETFQVLIQYKGLAAPSLRGLADPYAPAGAAATHSHGT